MTIPANLTHREIGAYLIAVGLYMVATDVTAEVAVDLASYTEPEEALASLASEMVEYGPSSLHVARAAHIIEQLTLVEAVTFNSFDGSHLAYDCVNDTWCRVTP